MWGGMVRGGDERCVVSEELLITGTGLVHHHEQGAGDDLLPSLPSQGLQGMHQ